MTTGLGYRCVKMQATETPNSESADALSALGLTGEEAQRRLRSFGPNDLVPQSKQSALRSWLVKFGTDPMAILLLATAGTYVFLGDRFDAVVVTVALVPIFLVSAVLEVHADAAIARLRDAVAPHARVRRDGTEIVVPARDVVPGDALLIDEGDVLVADAKLVAGARVTCDESTLTGESIPVDKAAARDGSEPPDLYAGTTVVAGSGIAVVTATGGATQYGRIGGLLVDMPTPPTPIERAIRHLLLQAGAGVLVVCCIVAVIERIHGEIWPAAIIAAVSLAMAAMPEELPMVYTLYLALGAWRLSKDHALVRRLGSVETLGATNVICVDKTGTLTSGRIELASAVPADGATEDELVRFALLAGDPESRDPLDQALRRFAQTRALALPDPRRLVTLEPFDPRRKAASAVWHIGTSELSVMKGALEVVSGTSDTSMASDALAEAAKLSSHGMRVIAVAADGALRGILAFADPVRPGIPAKIASCREAGIRIIMITGDHPLTAASIARTIGIPASGDAVVSGDELEKLSDAELAARLASVSVIARARPEHKLRIVHALRLGGATVAMTGDGTNDALALRDADIGIAMGEHGSDVARGASDLVLLDDDFSTIVNAVRDGRRIFDNLRHAFSYLVAFHAPLVLSALVVPLLGLPLLLMPIHLVILELIVHPTSSLVFEADDAAPSIMSRPPRPRNQGLLSGADWVRPVLIGGTLSIGVLAVYLLQLRFGALPEAARAAAFVTMIVGQAAIVLVERSPERPLWRGLQGNLPLAIALPATLALLPLAILVPGLNSALHFSPLTPAAWGVALLTAAVATLWYEPFKSVRR